MKNDDIRKKTGLRKLEDIIKERRLRWLGHVIRMEDSRIPRQATQWEMKGYKRKPGRAWTTKDKLDGHRETQREKHGHHLGGKKPRNYSGGLTAQNGVNVTQFQCYQQDAG